MVKKSVAIITPFKQSRLFIIKNFNQSQCQKCYFKVKFLTFWFYLWRQKRSERQKSNLTFNVLILFKFSDFQCSFWRSDFWRSDLLMIIKKTFDVLTLQRSDFWGSDPLPNYQPKSATKPWPDLSTAPKCWCFIFNVYHLL